MAQPLICDMCEEAPARWVITDLEEPPPTVLCMACRIQEAAIILQAVEQVAAETLGEQHGAGATDATPPPEAPEAADGAPKSARRKHALADPEPAAEQDEEATAAAGGE